MTWASVCRRAAPFPACAGMNRAAYMWDADPATVPRMRGDEPVSAGWSWPSTARSPHARG
ncbi:hypothetical protein METUNv1_02566 [Methyloversatilis universalis FAM5]|uniref:Uncharacterized protein n=1 Tax=Methyloversatilis universalis (strain ATCC BAA-1314 / DSM 25237 / JCM 13912 / CCUG 52030 / FAM5) TaxID=1000565 RepID=F5RE48_METUF|nr:hypothetical protein METUNv1_02566 [Methyloversatilis universalis FAM5]